MKTDSTMLQLSFGNAGTKEIEKEKRIKGFKFWNSSWDLSGSQEGGGEREIWS